MDTRFLQPSTSLAASEMLAAAAIRVALLSSPDDPDDPEKPSQYSTDRPTSGLRYASVRQANVGLLGGFLG